MADLHFLCPTCRQSLIVDEAGAGLATACGHCSTSLVIPNPSPHSVEYEERVLCADLKLEEERLQIEVANAQERIAELERLSAREAERMHAELAKLERKLTEECKRAADLNKKLEEEHGETGKQAASEDLQREIASLKAVIEPAREEAAEAQARVGELEYEREKRDSELAGARNRLASVEGEAQDLRRRIRADESALTAANEKLRGAADAKEKDEAELAELRKKLAQLRKDLAEATHALEAERAKTRSLAESLEVAQHEASRNADSQEGGEFSEETFQRMKVDLDEARTELDSSREAIRKFDRSLYAITTERDCFETMLNGLKANFAQVSERLAVFEAWAEANGFLEEVSNVMTPCVHAGEEEREDQGAPRSSHGS